MNFELIPDFGSSAAIKDYFTRVVFSSAVFLAAFAVLKKYLFGPLTNLLKIRTSATDEVEKEALKLSENSQDIKEEVDRRLDGAAQLAKEAKNIAQIVGKRRAEMIITGAKRESNRDFENIKKNTDEAIAAIMPVTKRNIEGFVGDIKEKILGD